MYINLFTFKLRNFLRFTTLDACIAGILFLKIKNTFNLLRCIRPEKLVRELCSRFKLREKEHHISTCMHAQKFPHLTRLSRLLTGERSTCFRPH